MNPNLPTKNSEQPPTISLIAAMSKNRVIGSNGKIPWHISDDFKRFKRLTTGHIIIMGRKTFESIVKPLPNRISIVITRQTDYKVSAGVYIASSIEDAIELSQKILHPAQNDNSVLQEPSTDNRELFIIGGAEIYKQALDKNLVDKIYLTIIDKEFEGDTYFPELDKNRFVQVESEEKESGDLKYRNMILQVSPFIKRGLRGVTQDLRLSYNKDLITNARNLRSTMTPGEILLWKRLKNRQMLGIRFHRQKPILNFIIDFYCITLKLAIEIDGSSHDENKFVYDMGRQKRLEDLGITFLRFTEFETVNRLEDVLQSIENKINEILK